MKNYRAEYTDASVLEFRSEDSSYAVRDSYARETASNRLFNLFEIDEEGVIIRSIIRFEKPVF